MRAASGLLVAVLLTTCVISGTFAKYITKSEGFDTARVARWGFTDTSITFNDLFKTEYDQNVKGEQDVIAPGTTNSAKFRFDYTKTQSAPEVAYTFKVDTDGSTCDTNIKNNKNIVWSLDGTEYTTDDQGTSWEKMIAAIKNLSGDNSGTKTYEAGKLPTGFENNSEHTVKWQWKFDDNSDTKENFDNEQNKEDTGMGNADTLGNVTLKITITATQID